MTSFHYPAYDKDTGHGCTFAYKSFGTAAKPYKKAPMSTIDSGDIRLAACMGPAQKLGSGKGVYKIEEMEAEGLRQRVHTGRPGATTFQPCTKNQPTTHPRKARNT